CMPELRVAVTRIGVPTGIRTPVSTVKGWCPRPLDDGGEEPLSVLSSRAGIGGARRDRTADLLHAMQALSQLSYGPTRRKAGKFSGAFAAVQEDRRATCTLRIPGQG